MTFVVHILISKVGPSLRLLVATSADTMFSAYVCPSVCLSDMPIVFIAPRSTCFSLRDASNLEIGYTQL